ncbi:probable inorganic phosphate transporter 1-9 [Coffea arabica]|uniref:Probable inorganic phosphate transporter 1-9 n=1 Tax=Coffea arabica TaxID=13443 RepID=A0A6P6U7U1_COFAR|nr:probable inorganic phosphate transporter 1-9 [Coffea arabica]
MALKVLSSLDTAKIQYYHFKAIIIAGMGLFTDAYDLFCIPLIMKLIGSVYYAGPARDQQVPALVTSAMGAIALLGTVIGQLVFGRLGDLLGRRKVYVFALLIMVFSSVGCGFSMGRGRTCVLLSLGLFRFSLGIGIGGDYPLSATIMSEFANKRTRGGFIAAVFSMQGFGILASSTVTMVVCAVFNSASGYPKKPSPEMVDLAWRLILMMGAIPAGLTCYWRMMMPETPRYTALVEKNVAQAAKDMRKVLRVPMSPIPEDQEYDEKDPMTPTASANPASSSDYPLLSKEFLARHGRDLFSCALAWFLVDVVFYSNNFFQSQIYGPQYLPLHNKNAYEEAFHVAKLQAILAICSAIPGYFAAVFFIDRIGRVRIQIGGFFFMAIVLFAIGIPYYSYWDRHAKAGFMFLYALTFFFSNFGPNTTTFIVPAELFPARFRSTCHGISGAAGKLGAIVGVVAFQWASPDNYHQQGIRMTVPLVLLGLASLVGCVTTYLFTRETMGRSLEENENEDQATSESGTGWGLVRHFSFTRCSLPKLCANNEVADG